MNNIAVVYSHQFITGEFTIGNNAPIDMLVILTPEPNQQTFVQIRKGQGSNAIWFGLCRYCWKQVSIDYNYECLNCLHTTVETSLKMNSIARDLNGIYVDMYGVGRINLIDRRPISAREFAPHELPIEDRYYTILLKMVPLLAEIDGALGQFLVRWTGHQKLRVVVGREIIIDHLAQPTSLTPEQWQQIYQPFQYQQTLVQLVGWTTGITILPE